MSEGPLRDTWEFAFPVHELVTACKLRAGNHHEHVRYWLDKLAEWEDEMEASAKVEEVPITGGVQRVLRYDSGLQAKVNDARHRRDAHIARAREYERWLVIFSHDELGTRKLRNGDVEFFFAPLEPVPGDTG